MDQEPPLNNPSDFESCFIRFTKEQTEQKDAEQIMQEASSLLAVAQSSQQLQDTLEAIHNVNERALYNIFLQRLISKEKAQQIYDCFFIAQQPEQQAWMSYAMLSFNTSKHVEAKGSALSQLKEARNLMQKIIKKWDGGVQTPGASEGLH